MAALGYTVNLSTLFALILAIGIVVDDAIVIVEGVSKYIEQGMSGHDAAIRAMNELFGPIVGITLVLMAVFLPSAFVPGLSGQIFAQFALVIAVTALISAVNAATLKPTQCALWLRTPKPVAQRNFFYRGFDRVYGRMEHGYAGLIGRMVRHAGLVVLIGVALAVVAVWGIARLPTAFIPNEDQGYLMIAAQLPDGASLGRTTAALDNATKMAIATPGVDQVISISGMSVLDNIADLANAGVSFVVLKPWDERSKANGTDILSIAEHLQNGLNAAPDGRLFVLAPPPIQGIGNAGGFQMQTELLGGNFDYQKLSDAADQIVKKAVAEPGLQHVLTTFRPGAPQVAVTVDRDRAETLRVSVGDVFSALTAYLGSTYVNQFNKFGLSLQVYAQADSKFRLQPDDLLNLYVRSEDNQMVPIGAVAHLSSTLAPPLITLYNLYPSATIVGAPARGFSSGQSLSTMESLADKTLPPGMSYQWTAMSYQEKLTGNQLYYLFGLVGVAGLPLSCRPVRELDFAVCGAVGGAAGAARAGHRADQSRRRQQSLHPDRPDPDDRVVGQKRHPDRRGRARRPHGPRQADPRSRGRRLAHAVPPDPDDLVRLRHGRLAVGAGDRRRRQFAHLAGVERAQRHHRLDLSRGAVRPLLFYGAARFRRGAQGTQASESPQTRSYRNRRVIPGLAGAATPRGPADSIDSDARISKTAL